MKIIDTEVLIATLDPEHPLYDDAIRHLKSVITSEDFYVPSIALMECDLVLKTHRFSKEERYRIFERLIQLLPLEKILPITPNILRNATELENDKEYFDALIASTALENKAEVISTDPIFSKEGIATQW